MFLFTGDRVVVHGLLNETMISIQPSSTALYYYFRFYNLLKLLAMTYVAAQKARHGVYLLCRC